jgi:DNA-3-methyladenine glycosylase I
VAVGGEGPAPDTGTVCRGSVSGVSNRSKSEATRANAGSVIRLRQDGGLEHLVWAHRPTLITVPHRPSEVSTTSLRSKPLAADPGARGFVFVGPTTAHALTEAIGRDDAHLVGWHRLGASGLFDAASGEPPLPA